MAKLTSFKVDSKTVEQGEWVSPGDEYDDLMILTRGFTDLYTDARAARMRRLAVGYGGDERKVPNKLARAAVADALIQHVLIDVKNLAKPDNTPVTFAEFCEYIKNPDYSDLFKAAVAAAAMVGMSRKQDVQDALGNSAPPSA